MLCQNCLMGSGKSGPQRTSIARMHLGTDTTMRHLLRLLASGTWASWTLRYARSNLWPAIVYCDAPLINHRLHCKFLCVPGSSFHVRCEARCPEQAGSNEHVKNELSLLLILMVSVVFCRIPGLSSRRTDFTYIQELACFTKDREVVIAWRSRFSTQIQGGVISSKEKGVPGC